MAKTNKDKEKFIELRAQGLSFDKISKQINISKPSLMRWEKEYESQIDELKFIELESLIEQYAMSKKQRIEKLGEYLKKIKDEIDKRNLDDIPTAKLFELHFSIFEKFKDEIDGISCDSIEKELDLSYNDHYIPKYTWELKD